MRKELNYLLFILLLFSSCEEYYHPDMDTVNGQLVVDAQITNDPTRNIVHLTKTRSFYDRLPVIEVSGATVELLELGNKTGVRAFEISSGKYSINFVPVAGKKYYLRIVINPETYESYAVTMPPLPVITKFSADHTLKKMYFTNENGVIQTFEKQMRDIKVDLPVTSSLSYFRFDVRSILEWTWDSVPSSFNAIPTAHGWYFYSEKEKFNIIGPKNFSQVSQINEHLLKSISYNPYDYFYSDTLKSKGWLLIVDQFGTSKESYEYHETLNSQFAADGSLFDPIQTQIFGNILCKSNPSKIVYGYFDLNSVQQVRYYLNLNTPPGTTTLRQIFRYPDIPDRDGMKRTGTKPPMTIYPPEWWEE